MVVVRGKGDASGGGQGHEGECKASEGKRARVDKGRRARVRARVDRHRR